MSVKGNKCAYSNKFLPLVKDMQSKGPEVFMAFLEENFEDAEQLYNRFMGNIFYDASPAPVAEVEQVDTRLGLKLNSEANSSVEFYIGDMVRHSNMLRNFKSRMIASSVFNRDTNKFIDANSKTGEFTLLNELIFNYKAELLNILSDFIQNPDLQFNDNMMSLDPDQLTKIANNIVSAFESAVNKADLDKTSKFYDAYDAYVVYSKFDQLIAEQVPFIQVKPELRNSNSFYIDKYDYRGPNVQHYTGWSTNEHTAADDHASDLSKILLDYFPEINEAGQEIESTSITLSGFNSIMTKLISAIQNTPQMNEYLSELDNGVKADMAGLLDVYLDNLNSDAITSEAHRTYLQNKVRAIRQFIYNPEMNQFVKDMFTQMAFKTVPASYVSYEYDNIQRRIAGKDLKERPITAQRYVIDDLIRASVYHFKANKSLFADRINKYNVKVTPNTITFDQIYEGTPTTFIVSYNLNGNGDGYNFKVHGNLSPQVMNDLVYDFMSYIVPDDIDSVSRQVYPLQSGNWGTQNLFMPLVSTVILAANGNSVISEINGLVDTKPYVADITSLANVLSVINGSDTINVIKNAEGNNLPLYQIISLAYNHHSVMSRIRQQADDNVTRNNVGTNNLIYLNTDNNFLLSPKIRSDVSINGKVKKPSTLTTSEVLRLAIVNDFYQNIKNGVINLQPTTFSDKNKHFLPSFNIKATLHNGVNIKEQLEKFFDGDKKALDKIVDTLYETRQNEINALVSNILTDYNEAFDQNFTTLDQINLFLEGNQHTLKSIQSAFLAKGLNFYLDIHAYKAGYNTRINETINEYNKTYNNRQLTDSRLTKQKKKFLQDLVTNNPRFNISDSAIANSFGQFNGWIDSVTGNVILAKTNDGKNILNSAHFNANQDKNMTLNPILEAYYITDTLLSNAYNNLMIGGVYAHSNKNSRENITSPTYNEHSEASRLVSQYKRMVIYGATYHPLAQNLKNGVPANIKIAVINDNQGTVWNMLGEENDGLDTMDGSGLVSPYYSRFENNSLLDARVGKDKKSIFHDIDSTYGRPTLLKWAAFEMSNERRRLSFMSDISQEKLFKKMHSIFLNQDIDLGTYYDNYMDNNDVIYFKDWRTNKYYFISNIQSSYEDGQLIATRTIHEVDKNSNYTPNASILTDSFVINSLYDLDQLFGGAYSMSYSDKYKNLQFSEANLDIVENIIVEEDLKDKMISYLVNKSAIKVGAGNINEDSSWFDDNALYTIDMATKFGGVQMNADHDLDLSEVTEMTQMISALEQNGYTHNITSNIYGEIGKVVSQSMQDFDVAIKDADKEKVYQILAKALINSFMNDDKDTLGLAQSFVVLANQSLQQSNLEYTLPFSASTINGAFISTTTSNLVKSGIRRKYAGVGAVLAPSNNMMQYFKIGNLNYTFDELVPIVQNRGVTNDYNLEGKLTRSAIEKVLSDVIVDGQLNPFIEIVDQNDIDFEDTILIQNADGTFSEPVKIDSFEIYDSIKRDSDPNLTYYNWTIKPKNLKQSNTFFDVVLGSENGNPITKRFNLYDLDSVRAAFYLRSVDPSTYEDLTETQRQVLISATGLTPTDLNTKINVKETLRLLQQRTQQQLDGLADGTFIYNNTIFNIPQARTLKPLNVTTTPAQIMMGKINASKLGLQPGDSISRVKTEGSDFFYNRMKGNYTISNSNKATYDAVLFTGTGREVYVKFGTEDDISKQFASFNINENSDFRIVDNIVYLDGIEVSNADEKQFYKYIDVNGNKHDLIVINNLNRLNELRKSNLFDTYKLNYTDDNIGYLLSFQFSDNLKNNRPIKLQSYDAMGNLQDVTFNVTDNNVNINANTLNANEELKFNQRLRKIAHNKFEAFEMQLNYVGARIPTQSMQSFMPMELVAFTDSEVNDVYVPKVQTWLQGSDYDIDKLYILGYSVNNNGSFQTTSALGNEYNVREVMKLPIPNGTKYSQGENGFVVTAEDINDFLRGNLDTFVNILNSDTNIVTFDPNIEKENVYEFMRDLNKHSLTNMTEQAIEEGLKNNIVSGIFDVILNAKNQVNLHVPINMEEQQVAARNTSLGEAEKTMTSDNPGSKFVMQIQNMVGKEVIGIVAVSVKGFFLLSNYYNTQFSNIVPMLQNEQYTDVAKQIDTLVFTNQLTGEKGVLANINFESILDYIKTNDIDFVKVDLNELGPLFVGKWGNYLSGDLFNVRQAIETLRNISNVPDASLILSGLLSAATDNAKELILAKINATSNYVDIYNYLISIGVPFNNIANIMTSEIFNYVVTLTEGNIFDPNTYGFSLDSAMAFYLNKKMLPILDPRVFEEIMKNFTKETSVEIMSLSQDTNLMEKLKNYLEPLMRKKRISSGEIDENQYFEETSEEDYSEQQSDEYEEYVEYYDEFGGYRVNPTRRDFTANKLNEIDYRKAYELVEYIIDRNNTLSSISNSSEEINNLNAIYERVIPATKEMQVLGRMAGINQGIRTNNYDKYSYIKNIENFINQRVKDYVRKTETDMEQFNLMKFLSDPVAKQQYIDNYEKLKTSHNILRAISTVPHFNEMFKILYYDNEMINQLSIKNKLESILSEEVLTTTGVKLNDVEFREMSKYTNDLIIYNWIKRINKTFTVPTGQSYFTNKYGNIAYNNIENFQISLNTTEGLASFKKIMDDNIIPKLKEDSNYKDNEFIKSLTLGVNATEGKISTYWKLPINMMQIDNSVKTQTTYEKILSDFNSLNGKTYNDWNIVDLFYMYNLLVNKDSFGQRALTRLFEDIVKVSDGNLLVNQFYKYMSEIDYDQNVELEYNLNDLKYRLALVSKSPYNKFSSYISNGVVHILDGDYTISQDPKTINTSYFTLNMPFVNSTNAKNVLKITDVKPKDNRYFRTSLDAREMVLTIANNFNAKYNGGINIINNQSLEGNNDPSLRNTKAFIQNGEVYINIDKADISSPLHEFTHVIMAGLKEMHPEVYYNLLSTVTTHPTYNDISNNPMYANKHGSDLDEEVFATIMSEYFNNKLYDWSENNKFTESDTYTKDVLAEIFQTDLSDLNLDIQSLMNVPLETALYNFGSLLVTWKFDEIIDAKHVKLNQRLATIKDELISQDIIEKECYG